MDIEDLDDLACYRGIYNIIRAADGTLKPTYKHPPSDEARRLAEAMPTPGTETQADRALIFHQAATQLLEYWSLVQDSNGIECGQYANRGRNYYGGWKQSDALASGSTLRDMTPRFRET